MRLLTVGTNPKVVGGLGGIVNIYIDLNSEGSRETDEDKRQLEKKCIHLTLSGSIKNKMTKKT